MKLTCTWCLNPITRFRLEQVPEATPSFSLVEVAQCDDCGAAFRLGRNGTSLAYLHYVLRGELRPPTDPTRAAILRAQRQENAPW